MVKGLTVEGICHRMCEAAKDAYTMLEMDIGSYDAAQCHKTLELESIAVAAVAGPIAGEFWKAVIDSPMHVRFGKGLRS